MCYCRVRKFENFQKFDGRVVVVVIIIIIIIIIVVVVVVIICRSRNSSVGIITGYELDGLSAIPDRGKGFFSTPQHTDTPEPNQLPIS
jgi:flagellar basal body-associated protein FliL